jgi:hypothetical protein
VRSTRLRLPARRRTRRCAHTRSAENQPPPASQHRRDDLCGTTLRRGSCDFCGRVWRGVAVSKGGIGGSGAGGAHRAPRTRGGGGGAPGAQRRGGCRAATERSGIARRGGGGGVAVVSCILCLTPAAGYLAEVVLRFGKALTQEITTGCGGCDAAAGCRARGCAGGGARESEGGGRARATDAGEDGQDGCTTGSGGGGGGGSPSADHGGGCEGGPGARRRAGGRGGAAGHHRAPTPEAVGAPSPVRRACATAAIAAVAPSHTSPQSFVRWPGCRCSADRAVTL